MLGDPRHALRAAARALAQFDRRKGKQLTVAPDFYDLPYEEVTLTADDGVRLAAWFVPAPPGAERELMVLMHHHYGGQKAALLPWLELFHRLGVASVAFDARDHAGSPCRRGQGSYVQRFADVRAARDELRRRGAKRVLAYAQSQGGAVVLGAIGACRDLCGVIVDSGPAPSALLSLWGLARDLPPPDVPLRTLAAGAIVVELVRRMRPSTYPVHLWRGLLAMRDRPLLWLHGTEDQIIPQSWSRQWFDSLRPITSGWVHMSIEGAHHAECLQHGGAAVAGRVAAFVDELRQREAGS